MLRNVVILITANAGNDFQTARRPQKGTATARNPALWVESLKSAVYGFESLTFFLGTIHRRLLASRLSLLTTHQLSHHPPSLAVLCEHV